MKLEGPADRFNLIYIIYRYIELRISVGVGMKRIVSTAVSFLERIL